MGYYNCNSGNKGKIVTLIENTSKDARPVETVVINLPYTGYKFKEDLYVIELSLTSTSVQTMVSAVVAVNNNDTFPAAAHITQCIDGYMYTCTVSFGIANGVPSIYVGPCYKQTNGTYAIDTENHLVFRRLKGITL